MEKVSDPPPGIYPLRAGLHPQKDNLDKLVRLLYFSGRRSGFLTIYKNIGKARGAAPLRAGHMPLPRSIQMKFKLGVQLGLAAALLGAAAAGQAADLKIGMVLPMSGPFSSYGQQIL